MVLDAADHRKHRAVSLGLVLGSLWGLLVVAAALVLRRGQPRAVRAFGQASRGGQWSAALGRVVRSLSKRHPDPAADLRVGRALMAGALLGVVDPRLGVGAGLGVYLLPILVQRRDRLALEAAVAKELPEVIDLIRLSLASGGAILLALRGVAARPIGPISAALGDVCLRIERGHRTADSLDQLVGATTAEVRSLVRALVGAEHYGTELMPTLERLAGEARDARRRRAQIAARRVPIRLLLPLVLCILPAFVLLTLVPTLAGTLDGLDLG